MSESRATVDRPFTAGFSQAADQQWAATGEGFRISERSEARHVRVLVTGELDLATSPVLQDHLRHLARQRADVHLDLSKLQFIDVAGARAIEQALITANTAGTRLTIVDMSPQVSRLFELLDRSHTPSGRRKRAGRPSAAALNDTGRRLTGQHSGQSHWE